METNVIKFKKLSQFYTKNEVSVICTNYLLSFLKNSFDKDLKDYIFIEPSAGYGCFVDSFVDKKLNIVSCDIEPKHKLVLKKDFLKEYFIIKSNKEKIIIGNPPFGKRSKMAIDFFNKASEYSDVIAFILPNQFKKYSVHSKLNKEYKLVKEYKLKEDSFYIELKNNYNINCVFQIWTKKNTKLKDLRLKTIPPIIHKDFEMYQYNNTEEALKIFDNDFDFAIFSQGYGDYKKLIYDKKKMDKKKQWLLFKAKNKKILKNLKKLDFEKLSRNNTIIPGFRKNNVVQEYIKLYGQ